MELACHHLGVTDAGTQGLLFEDYKEASVACVEELLTFQACREGLVEVVGDLLQLDSVSDDR